MIRTADGEFRVEDTIKLLGGKIGHVGVVTKGMIKVGDTAELEVNAETCTFRKKSQLQRICSRKRFRTVLGSHVEQVDPVSMKTGSVLTLLIFGDDPGRDP